MKHQHDLDEFPSLKTWGHRLAASGPQPQAGRGRRRALAAVASLVILGAAGGGYALATDAGDEGDQAEIQFDRALEQAEDGASVMLPARCEAMVEWAQDDSHWDAARETMVELPPEDLCEPDSPGDAPAGSP